MTKTKLFKFVKQHLIVSFPEDDAYIRTLVSSRMRWAENILGLKNGHFDKEDIPEYAANGIALAISADYNNRDGTGSDTTAAEKIIHTGRYQD